MIQAFRRAASIYESARIRLSGLEPAARYQVTNLDMEGAIEATGQELMEKGLPIVIKDQPGSAVVTYKRMR